MDSSLAIITDRKTSLASCWYLQVHLTLPELPPDAHALVLTMSSFGSSGFKNVKTLQVPLHGHCVVRCGPLVMPHCSWSAVQVHSIRVLPLDCMCSVCLDPVAADNSLLVVLSPGLAVGGAPTAAAG